MKTEGCEFFVLRGEVVRDDFGCSGGEGLRKGEGDGDHVFGGMRETRGGGEGEGEGEVSFEI